MAKLYITRTEAYAVCQNPVGVKFADYMERKLREDGLITTRHETTTGISIRGEHIISVEVPDGGDAT